MIGNGGMGFGSIGGRGGIPGSGGNKGGDARSGSSGGLPFAGVPPELEVAVTKLVAKEPDHGEPTAKFSHRAKKERPLTLSLLLKQRWKIGIIAFVFIAIETIGLQSGPFLTQVGIDSGLDHFPHPRINIVVECGIAYIVSVMITALVERSRIRTTGRLAANIMNDLRVKVFTHIQRLSLDFYTGEKTGVIMTRMTSDIEVLQQLLQDGIAQFAIQAFTMVAIAALLFTYNVKLALITLLLVVPGLTGVSIWCKYASERSYIKVRDALAAVIGDIAESLQGVRVVAAYNRQRQNVVRHRNIVGHYRKTNYATAVISSVYTAISDFIGLIGQTCLLLIGGDMVLHHHLTVGELTAFILYLGGFFQPIQQLVQLYNTYQQGNAAITKLRMLLNTDPSVMEAENAYDLPPISGEVELRDVMFAYKEGQPVLEDVNIKIAAGETVSFVGPTGAGKSTIAKLVTRFYDPTEGKVLIDGHPIDEVSITSLRRQLGVVPQEPFLFSGSVRDNVAFANPDATEEEILHAISLVGLDDLIERLPDGIDTEVHERGQSLSSGERQLLALARAFVAQPRVLILDEATSNLDLQSETKVEAALDVLLEGRTAILVAHRLSTAMRADRIVVVDHGRIEAIGTHQELVNGGGLYEKMYATWISQGDHPEEIDLSDNVLAEQNS